MSYMRNYIQELTKTVTATTAGAGTGISTGHINGFISDVYISINKAAGATDLVTIAMSSDADRNILVAANPSTSGAYYHHAPLLSHPAACQWHRVTERRLSRLVFAMKNLR